MKKLILYIAFILFPIISYSQVVVRPPRGEGVGGGDSTWVTITVQDSLILENLASDNLVILNPTSTGKIDTTETSDISEITIDTLTFNYGDVTNDLDVGDTIEFDNGAQIHNEETDTLFLIETVVKVEGELEVIATTEQLRLSYDPTNYFTVTLADNAHTTIATVDPDGAEADINFAPDGNVGIKTVAPGTALEVTGVITASGGFTDGIFTVDGSGAFTAVASLVATGTISGNTGVTLDTDATIVLADTDCRNSARFNNDADVIDYTLPGAAAGLVVVFYDIGGGVITVDPVDGTDTIYLNGTSVGAGDAIDSPGAVGDFICLMAIDATRWVTVGRSGTWVDGGAD